MIRPYIFILNRIFFLTLVTATYSTDFDDFGARLSEKLNRELAPLQNLGPRISARVYEELEPIRSGKLNRDINRNVRQRLAGLDGLGDRISSQVQSGLKPLDNLGQRIEQSVYQGLEPVRALEVTFKMKDGIGGTTIATHLPGGKKFIVRNRQVYQCSGIISDETGQCGGNLAPFQENTKQDFCLTTNGYSIVNDNICLGATSVSIINNNIRCESYSNRPTLLIKLDEYRKMCQGISERVEYRYLADVNDPAHVQIPNPNQYVRCTNNQPGICVFYESHSLPQGSNTIIVNNYG